MIGKRTAECGVTANLCTPDLFILVVTSYHRCHGETLGHSSQRALGVWFIPDPTNIIFIYEESPRIRASKKNLPPPPPPPPENTRYKVIDLIEAVCTNDIKKKRAMPDYRSLRPHCYVVARCTDLVSILYFFLS